MRWVFLVVVLVGCAEESRVGVQSTWDDARTAEEVLSEGSCGCPSGHALYCDGQGGTEVALVDSCDIWQDRSEFRINTFSAEIEANCDIGFSATGDNDVELDARAREVMFCNPL